MSQIDDISARLKPHTSHRLKFTAYRCAMSPNFFRASALALMMIAQFSGLIAVFWSAKQAAVNEAHLKAKAALTTHAKTVSQIVESQLKSAENLVDVAERVVPAKTVSVNSSAALGQLLNYQLIAEPTLEGVFFARPDGTYVGVNRDGDRYKATETFVHDGRQSSILTWYGPGLEFLRSRLDTRELSDPRTRPWYRRAMEQTGRPVWTDSYPGTSNGDPGVAVAQTIHATHGEILGVVGADFNVLELSNRISSRFNDDSLRYLVIDRAGQVVASNFDRSEDAENALRTMGGVSGPEHLWQSRRQELLLETAQPALMLGAALASDKGGFRYSDTANRLSLVMPLLIDQRDSGWTVLTGTVVTSTMFSSDTQVSNLLSLLAAIIVIPPLIALPVLVWLSRPFARLVESATMDGLTGSLSRLEFERRLKEMLLNRRGSDQEGQVILIAMDLDGFKAVNDTHGHSVGDEVLLGFVKRLRARIRPGDLIGRFGGDEFMVVLRLEASSSPHDTAERIRAAATNRAFSTKVGRVLVGATAGVATHSENESLETLIVRADQALILGKAREKNRTYLASAPTDMWPTTGVESEVDAQPVRSRAPTS